MHNREVTKLQAMERWISRFEEYDVFFSSPLDLDFLMQRSFTDVYEVIPEGGDGPDIPGDQDGDREDEIKAAVKSVLKKKGMDGSTYSEEEKMSFFWYRYLFLGRGKPTTHLLALAELDAARLSADGPPVLKRLVANMKEQLGLFEAQEAEDVF